MAALLCTFGSDGKPVALTYAATALGKKTPPQRHAPLLQSRPEHQTPTHRVVRDA